MTDPQPVVITGNAVGVHTTEVDPEPLPEFVHMTHPDIEGPPAGPVTGQAFLTIYQAKGWVLATDDAVQAAAEGRAEVEKTVAALQVEDVDGMDREALEQAATVRGIDPTIFQPFKGPRPSGDYWLDGLRAAVRANIEDATVFPSHPVTFPQP